jgi:mannan endo-1,4-beta-mannosidase
MGYLQSESLRRSRWKTIGIIVIFLSAVISAGSAQTVVPSGAASSQTKHNDEFVQHVGTKLVLGGEDFRYSGPNIEWLGIENYGPSENMGPRYPTHFEVDDALDTAKMMGARVIRSQTLGDSVGCELCIEPKPGEFNSEAFRSIDYAVKAAHERGLRLVVTLIGDCTYCDNGGIGQYIEWSGSKNMNDFFRDPKLIAMFEKHIAALLNHKSTLTGIALKDDPTIMAWENCNMCALAGIMTSGPKQKLVLITWVDTIGAFIKSIDKNHIYSDNSALFLMDPRVLDDKTPDLVTAEYYPHFNALYGMIGMKNTADTFSEHAAVVTSHGKAYSACEYGWDATNWPTRDDFQAALTAMESDPKISGDGFWALYAHAPEYGWQPMVMPTTDIRHVKAVASDTGQWWSLYYGGIDTLVNSSAEMRARAEMLRSHAFKMAGLPVPPHPIPPAPIITTKSLGIVRWRGSAGAVNYSVERSAPDGKWELVCDKCAIDSDMGWPDLSPKGLMGAKYRITAYNADGEPSAPSAAR